MRKNLLILLTFLVSVSMLNAQVTLTNAVFPATGDVLKTRQATSLNGAVSVTAAGPNQTWDFSQMTGGILDTTVVVAASTGTYAALFPSANIILETSILPGENYLETGANSMSIVGFAGDVLGIGVIIPAVFEDPFVLLQTPTNYQDTYTDHANFEIEIGTANYPALVAYLDDSLGLAAAGIEVDSLRLTYTATILYNADSWGNLTVPETGAFDVLRVKQSIYSNIVVEFKGKFANIPFNWSDPSQVPGAPALPFAGPGTNVNYFFYNDVAKETIAVIEMNADDSTQISEVTYKSEQTTSVFGFAGINVPSVKAYPNPAVSNLNLEVKNFTSGNYNVKVYNIIGRELMSEKHYINGDKTINVNTSTLPKGTYLYNISDEKGVTILSRRFMVARP